jgi:hypothetical protein
MDSSGFLIAREMLLSMLGPTAARSSPAAPTECAPHARGAAYQKHEASVERQQWPFTFNDD